MNIQPAVITSAQEAGLTMVPVGDRVEARTDKNKVIAFHSNPEKCLKIALERMEADRIKNLPYPKTGEPDLTGLPAFLDRKVNGIKPAAKTAPPPGPAKTAPVIKAAPVEKKADVVAPVMPVPEAEAPKPEKKAKPPKAAKPAKAAKPIIVKDDKILAPGVIEAGEPQKQIKGSIIKSKYKARYKQHGMSCGDDVADELKAYITVTVGGRQQVDLKRLQKVAELNGVWKPTYAKLNNGQQRMTVGNRLRALYMAGEKVNFDGPVLQKEFPDAV